MKIVKNKILNICSDGSCFFSLTAYFKKSKQFVFYEKDYIDLFSKKNLNYNRRLKINNNYKKKYF